MKKRKPGPKPPPPKPYLSMDEIRQLGTNMEYSRMIRFLFQEAMMVGTGPLMRSQRGRRAKVDTE